MPSRRDFAPGMARTRRLRARPRRKLLGGDRMEEFRLCRGIAVGLHILALARELRIGSPVQSHPAAFGGLNPCGELRLGDASYPELHIREAVAAEVPRQTEHFSGAVGLQIELRH